jgi:hypothetical protein
MSQDIKKARIRQNSFGSIDSSYTYSEYIILSAECQEFSGVPLSAILAEYFLTIALFFADNRLINPQKS